MKNYYELLHLPPEATPAQVQEAYQKFRENLLRYQPAKDIDPDALIRNQFPDVLEAYEVLSHPAQRAEYDAEWKKEFRREPLPQISKEREPVFSSGQSRVIISFDPSRAAGKLRAVTLIFGIFGLVAAIALLIYLLTLKYSDSFLSQFGDFSHMWLRLALLAGISLLLIFYRRIRTAAAEQLTQVRGVDTRNGVMRIHFRDGHSEVVKAITFYRYFVLDAIYANVYTEDGRKYSLYMPAMASFRSQLRRDEYAAVGQRFHVLIKEKPFFVVNAQAEGFPDGIKASGAYSLTRILFPLITIVVLAVCFYFPVSSLLDAMEQNGITGADLLPFLIIAALPLTLQMLTGINNRIR